MLTGKRNRSKNVISFPFFKRVLIDILIHYFRIKPVIYSFSLFYSIGKII